MRRSDTSRQMQQEYDQRWRQLSPEQRFLKGLELIHASRTMLLAGLRATHPHHTEAELRQVLLQRLYQK